MTEINKKKTVSTRLGREGTVMEEAVLTHSENDAMSSTKSEADTKPCICPQSQKSKTHISPLIVVKKRIDEGMQPMELAQDEKYFDIVMKNITFLEKYTLHIKSQRQQQEIYKVLDRVVDHVVVTEKDGPIPGL